MIDVIISSECPHCETQLDHMRKSYFKDEYRIISVDSTEFDALSEKDMVKGVPFLIVRSEDGDVKYAGVGIHDGTKLRKIERGPPARPFNLKRVRAQA